MYPKPSETFPPASEPTSETFPPPSEPSEPIRKPYEPTSQTSEPNLTLPTIDEAFAKFLEKSTSKLRHLFDESRVSDNPSEVRTHWNGFIRWITSKVFKLKGFPKQAKNDYIRGAEERLEARLA